MSTHSIEVDTKNAPISFFAQLISYIPKDFVLAEDAKSGTGSNATKFTAWDHVVALLFCHLAGSDSLREIDDGLYSAFGKLNHVSAKAMKRTSLAYANANRSYELMQKLYFKILELNENLFKGKGNSRFVKPAFSLDSTTISVCLSRFQWAHYRRAKGGFKLHTLISNDTLLPQVIDMTTGKTADVKKAKETIEQLDKKDVTVVMDRGYNDYELFSWLTDRGTKFVTRLKDNAKTTRLKDDIIEETEHYGDYRFQFTGDKAQEVCQGKSFRLIQWYDQDTDRWFEFLTNDFDISAPEVADLYRHRWQIELFFKKLKQNLKVKSFIGTSKNAVMSQIWTAAIAILLHCCPR